VSATKKQKAVKIDLTVYLYFTFKPLNMKKFLVLFVSALLLTACGNSEGNTNGSTKDTTAVKDSTTTTDYNPAAPPAQNSEQQ
jgi:hypothetical protein